MFTVIRWMMVATVLLVPCQAHAYLGPGAGLSAVGSVLALIGATLLLVVGFVWYPIKRLLKRRRSNPSRTEPGADVPVDSDPEQ